MSQPLLPYYKEYIQKLRRLELEEVQLQVVDDVSPKLKNYMKRILETEFRNGSIHAYYGKIKDCISSFDEFWSDTVDKAIVNTDKCCHIDDKTEALAFVESSISQQVAKQLDFGREYITMKSAEEKEKYESIDDKYQLYIRGLQKVKEAVQDVAPKYFPAPVICDKVKNSAKKLNEMCEFTHTYIALAVADCLYIIRSSLEDNLVRVRRNFRDLQAVQNTHIRDLVQQLYDCNKTLMQLERRDPDNQLELVETKYNVKLASQRLEDYRQNQDAKTMKVTEQLKMWQKRIEDFEPIAHVLKSLKKDLEHTVQEQKTYGEKKCLELPGKKRDKWELMGVNLQRRKEFLNGKIIHAAKTLMTYFHVQGPTIELHKDENNWPFFYDDYGHKVYQLEHGLRQCHLTCDGALVEIAKHDVLFGSDDYGQYREENGEKIYQRSNCGSEYKLDEHENLFNRMSVDCGHSQTVEAHCDTKIRHYRSFNEREKTEDLRFKGKLDPETTKYIWDTFGHILPEALAEVAKVKPMNPLKYLGNRLLKLHYSWTSDVIAKRKEASAKFREEILDGRKQKLIAATLAVRGKHRERAKQPITDDDAVMKNQVHAMHWWHVHNL